MKKAFIIATGTELLLGSTIDTNSVFIAQRLMEAGIKVIGRTIVGDQYEEIYAAFAMGAQLADIIISSGGLGPTKDDLTKETACDFMQVELEVIDDEVAKIKEYFARRRKPMPESNIKQAMFPGEAIILANKVGTAPGMYLFKEQKTVIVLPGPPKEMKKMFLEEVEPLLQEKLKLTGKIAVARVIKVFGPGESQVEEMIKDVMDDPQGCSIALLAADGEINVRITAEGEDQEASQRILDGLTEKIKADIGPYIYGYDEDTLSSVVAGLLKEKGLTVAVAESCTGGYLSKTITDLPGSSGYFWGGAVTYSNEAKNSLIGVNNDIISHHGAVSEETAREMAWGVKKASGSNIAIAITGIAGPDGGTDDKPVGLVYLAAVSDEREKVFRVNFNSDREGNRILAVKSALDIVRRYLNDK